MRHSGRNVVQREKKREREKEDNVEMNHMEVGQHLEETQALGGLC